MKIKFLPLVIFALAILVVGITSCYFYFRTNAAQKQLAYFQLDQTCSQSAAAYEQSLKSTLAQAIGLTDANKIEYNFTSHYDGKLNKCFVLWTSWEANTNGTLPSTETGEGLADAVEQKDYGQFDAINTFASPTSTQTQEVFECYMQSTGDATDKINCSSQSQFEDYVKPYMNE